MRYVEATFAAPLDRWIECAWMAEGDGHDGATQTIVPDGCPELIVQLADPFEVVGEDRSAAQPRTMVVGPQPAALRIRPTGRVATFGVRFRPGGLAAFTGIPLAEMAGRSTAVVDAFGAGARTLAERVAEGRRMADRVQAVTEVLAPLAAARRVPPAAEAAVAALVRARGQLGVDSLARTLGLGPRHLERVFGASVGLTPKRLARIVRLQEVLRQARNGAARWVDVALDCGYTDQAHLARDFRDLTGEAPARWFAAEGALASHFTSPARLEAFFAR